MAYRSRIRTGALLIVWLLVVGCGDASAPSASSAIVGTPSPGSSCPSGAPDPAAVNGVRVRHDDKSFALTLPPPWVEVDLATGQPTGQFPGATIPLEWGVGQIVETIAQNADNYGLLAVNLAPTPVVSSGHPLFEDLAIQLRPGDGQSGSLTESTLISWVRDNGVTGDVESAPARIDGQDGTVVRFATSQRLADGQVVEALVSVYGELRDGQAYLLLFNGPATMATATADAIAASFTFTVAGCSSASS